MLHDSIIKRMKKRLPFLNSQVGGASEYDAMESSGKGLTPPFAFVLPLGLEVTNMKTHSSGFVSMDISHGFEVAVTLNTANDDRNSVAVNDAVELNGYIIGLLFGFVPAKGFEEIEFKGQIISRDKRERLIYSYRFAVEQQGIESRCFNEMEALEDGGFVIKPLSNSNLNVNGVKTDISVKCEECP